MADKGVIGVVPSLDQDFADLLEIRRGRRPYEHIRNHFRSCVAACSDLDPDSGLFADPGDGTYARSRKLLIRLNFPRAQQFFPAGRRAAKVA
jgi:hypothetical protein